MSLIDREQGMYKPYTETSKLSSIIKRAYPVQRAPALCGVWGRVSVASLTLACAIRGDRDSNPGPSGPGIYKVIISVTKSDV